MHGPPTERPRAEEATNPEPPADWLRSGRWLASVAGGAIAFPIAVLVHELGHFGAFAAFGFPDPVLRFSSTSWSGSGGFARLLRAGDMEAAAALVQPWQVAVGVAAGAIVTYLTVTAIPRGRRMRVVFPTLVGNGAVDRGTHDVVGECRRSRGDRGMTQTVRLGATVGSSDGFDPTALRPAAMDEGTLLIDVSTVGLVVFRSGDRQMNPASPALPGRSVPASIPRTQRYYWSRAWQAAEREALRELEEGKGVEFDDPDEAIRG